MPNLQTQPRSAAALQDPLSHVIDDPKLRRMSDEERQRLRRCMEFLQKNRGVLERQSAQALVKSLGVPIRQIQRAQALLKHGTSIFKMLEQEQLPYEVAVAIVEHYPAVLHLHLAQCWLDEKVDLSTLRKPEVYRDDGRALPDRFKRFKIPWPEGVQVD